MPYVNCHGNPCLDIVVVVVVICSVFICLFISFPLDFSCQRSGQFFLFARRFLASDLASLGWFGVFLPAIWPVLLF